MGDAGSADKLPAGTLIGCVCIAGNVGCGRVNGKDCIGVSTTWLLSTPTAGAGETAGGTAGGTTGGTTCEAADGTADGGDTDSGAAAGGANCTGWTGGIHGGPGTDPVIVKGTVDATAGAATEAAGAASTAKPCNGKGKAAAGAETGGDAATC